MIKKFLLHFHLFCLLSLLPASGSELSIIQDKDGYTNVREKPSSKSEIVHKLLDNEVFSAYFQGKETQWMTVRYQDKQGNTTFGYVHHSRVLPLSNIKEYKGEDIKLSYLSRPFDAKAHRIGKNQNGGVGSIDGLHVWGTDGGLPRRETIDVKLSLKGKAIVVEKSKFANLYEMSKGYTVYEKGGTYFILQFNSDGAGGYQVVWVINNNGLKQRWVSSGD